MTKFLKRFFMGYVLATLIAVGVHFRSQAIQRIPPPKLQEGQKVSGTTTNDRIRDVMRIRDEIYDPIRPVSKGGSFVLTLEKTAYALPGILVISLTSPTFLPALAYPGQLREAHRSRFPIGAPIPDDFGSLAELEGLAWGVSQGIVFYLPFFVGRRRKARGEDSHPGDSELRTQHAAASEADRERSVLDSAIQRCDD
jgi:hypothetical protein